MRRKSNRKSVLEPTFGMSKTRFSIVIEVAYEDTPIRRLPPEQVAKVTKLDSGAVMRSPNIRISPFTFVVGT